MDAGLASDVQMGGDSLGRAAATSLTFMSAARTLHMGPLSDHVTWILAPDWLTLHRGQKTQAEALTLKI